MKRIESSSHFSVRTGSLEAQLVSLSREAGIPVRIVDFGEFLPPFFEPTLGKLPQFIRDYVQAPTIAFEPGIGHTVRRDFAALLCANPDLSNWYESNRLRYNHLMGLTLLPLIYEKELASVRHLAEALTKAVTIVPPSTQFYETLDLEDRIAVTKEVARQLKVAYLKLQPQYHDFEATNYP